MAAKTRAEAHQQQSIMALRHLADIDATTGLKPWSQALKDYRAAQGQGLKSQDIAIKQQRANADQAYKEGLLKHKERFTNVYETLKKDDQKLKALGINFNYDKLSQAKDIADMQDKRMREIASLNAKVRLQTATQADMTKRAQLVQKYQHDNAWLAMETQKHNDILEKWSHERDPLTGKPKYADEKGNAIDFSQYKTDFEPMQQQQSEPDPQDLSAAIDLVHTGAPEQAPTAPYGQQQAQQMMQQQQAPPQQQAAPAAMPAPQNLKAGFQEIARARGLKPEDAKRLFIDAAMRRGIPYAQAVQMLGAQ